MVHAVATDGRSYSKELFDQCMRILFNRRIKSEVLNLHLMSVSHVYTCV